MGPENLSESRGTRRLRRGTEAGVLRRGRGLVGVANWVELRRGTGGMRFVEAGILSRGMGLLPAFKLGVRVGVALWRVWLEGCSFFKAWHSHRAYWHHSGELQYVIGSW